MATTFVEYTGDGNATKQFTFPSYQESDVKVRVDGVLKTTSTHYNITNYTTTGGGNVVFTSGNIPSSPAEIRIYRDTSVDAAKATYTAGSSVKAADLNNNNTQLLYRAQEEQVPNLIQSYDIDASAIETSNVKDSAVTTAKIAADAVTNAKIADDQIDSEHYVDLSIDTQHIANENVTTAKLAPDAVVGSKLADNAVDSEHYTDGSIDREHLAADIVDGTKIADNSINSEHYVDGSIDTAHIADAQVTTAKIADGAITDAKIQGGSLDNRYYTEAELDAGQLDNRYYTEAESDARYFNISTGDTIKDGDTFPDNDTTIATTAAINDRIIDLVDDVGGFVPIANETSFPTANPDVNNGAGTLVSIKAISSTRTPSNGTVSIANGSGSNTVLITGCGSTVLTAGFGVIVETTTTLHTYAFHRLVPKATEVTTVAGISSNVTTVAGISGNVTTVAGISSDVTTVAGISSNVTSVANNASNINAVAADASDIGVVAADGTDIGLVAGSISNVNSVAGSIANVNTTASNIANVNNFASTYQIASSAPSTDGGGNALAAGDLYFDTSSNELRVYNGSSFQGGVTATGNLAGLGANTFTGNQTITNSEPSLFFVDANNNSDFAIRNNDGVFGIRDTTNNVERLTVASDGTVDIAGNLDANGGLDVTGNITVSGNVDGRDVAADGTKLDGISSSAIANVVQDTTPQLGGDLDVQSSKITTSTSNGNVKLEPNGTGVVEIRGAGSDDGTLQLNCSANSHGIKLTSPPHSAAQNYTLTFPSSLTNNGVLTTNSSGTLSAGLLATANIADSAVTRAKIADGEVISAKLDSNAVTTSKINNDAVTADKLANTSVTAGSYGSATAIPAITVDAQGRITAASTNTVNTTTNLATNQQSDSVIITSSTGNNATISEATSSVAGVMSTAHHDKLDGIEAGATADQSASEILTAIKTVDGAGSGLDADTLDGVSSASFVRSDASDSLSGQYNFSDSGNDDIINFTGNSTSDGRGISFNSRTALSADYNDGYLRLNNASEFTNGVFTPGVIRADGGINWNGTQTIVNGSGQLNAARLTGALPAIDGSALTGIAAAKGGGSDKIFWENGQNVTSNYTITNGYNAMSAGPITINSGVTVTVGAGETWTVV